MNSIVKVIGLGILAAFVLVVGMLVIRPEFSDWIFEPEKDGVRMVVSKMNRIVVKHSNQVKSETFDKPGSYVDENGRIIVGKVQQTAFSAADQVRGMRNIRDASIARAQGRSTRIAVPYTDVKQPWTNCIPFYEPLIVESTGYVINMRRRTRDDSTPMFEVPLDDGYEKVGPNGTVRGNIGKGYSIPLPDDDRYLAFIGRVVHEETRQPLTAPFLIGAAEVLDPAVVGATGCLQTAVNQSHHLGMAVGGFKYTYRPAPQEK